MDAILGTFISAFQSGAANLQGKAMGLLFILMTIDFFLSVIKSLAQGGTNYFSLFLQKLFPYGAIIYMVSNYAYLISVVMEGFLQVGQIVGGSNLSHSPEEIFGKGVQLFSDALNKISEDENLSFMNMIKGEAGGALFTAIATFLGYLGIFICFAIIALQMAICYLEFYLGAAFLIIFLPFLVFKPMAFLGEKAIGFVIGFGVKYMVLVAVAGVSLKSIDSLVDQASADPSFMAILTVLGAASLIAWLCWQAPALAAGIMSGGPSLSGASVAHAGLAAAGAAIGGMANLASKSTEKSESNGGGGQRKASKTDGGDSGGNGGISPNGAFNDSSGGNVLNSENAGGENKNNSSSGESNSSEQNSSSSASFSSGAILNGESGGSSNISNSPKNSSNSTMGSNSSQESKASTASGTNSNNSSANSGISSNPAMGSNSSQESKASTVSGTNSNSSFVGSQNTNSSINSGSSSSGNGVLKSDSTANNSSASTETTNIPMSEKIKNAGEKMQNVLNKANSLIPDEEHPQGGIQARIE